MPRWPISDPVEGKLIDIGELVDRQKLGRFHLKLGLWLFLAMLLDGYDLLAGAFATPAIIKAWKVPSSQMRYFLSASLLGVMFGAILFGYFGDRRGRKKALVAAAALFGASTVACALAPNLEWLTVFRFIGGIGIGGVMPNAVALAAEMAPKGAQATFITLMFIGTPAGGLLPGPVAAWLVPSYGWQVIFWIGGILPLIIAGLLLLFLPESIRYLAQDDRRRERTAAIACRIDPTLQINSGDRFVRNQIPARQGAWLSLFRQPFNLVTPLLASLFIVNFMVLYFMVSWMPQLLDQASASRTLGIWATSIFQLAGVAGGIIMSRFLDKGNLVPIGILFACSVPVIAVTGYAVHTPALLMLDAFLSGLCVVGLQFGLNATAGVLYPTVIRSKGVGFAFGVGRFGAVAGPLIGGAMIASAFPIRRLYFVAALPMALGAVICYGLIRLQRHDANKSGGQMSLS